jgi:hypothetical protein
LFGLYGTVILRSTFEATRAPAGQKKHDVCSCQNGTKEMVFFGLLDFVLAVWQVEKKVSLVFGKGVKVNG